MNDNYPTFPLSQYIVQGIAETVAVGTDIVQGMSALVIFVTHFYSHVNIYNSVGKERLKIACAVSSNLYKDTVGQILL